MLRPPVATRGGDARTIGGAGIDELPDSNPDREAISRSSCPIRLDAALDGPAVRIAAED